MESEQIRIYEKKNVKIYFEYRHRRAGDALHKSVITQYGLRRNNPRRLADFYAFSSVENEIKVKKGKRLRVILTKPQKLFPFSLLFRRRV